MDQVDYQWISKSLINQQCLSQNQIKKRITKLNFFGELSINIIYS